MATKTTMTAAEARELADRLDAEERNRVAADREARRKARLAKAHELLGTFVDGTLSAARVATDAALDDAINAVPLDLAAVANAYAAQKIAHRVHRDATNHLVRQVWQESGQPMRPNPGSAPSHDYIRPVVEPEDLRMPPGRGIGVAFDGVIASAAVAASGRAIAAINAQLADAETKPPVNAIVNAATFKADKALILDSAEFTARLGDDDKFDLSAFYFTTSEPGLIERLRSTPGVAEATGTADGGTEATADSDAGSIG